MRKLGEKGQALVEYLLIIAVISVIVVSTWWIFTRFND